MNFLRTTQLLLSFFYFNFPSFFSFFTMYKSSYANYNIHSLNLYTKPFNFTLKNFIFHDKQSVFCKRIIKIILPTKFLQTKDCFGLWWMLAFFQFMEAVFYVSACNLLVEADCSRFRLAKFSPIIGCLVKLCRNSSRNLSEVKNHSFCSSVILDFTA